ncbi:Na+/H+ antiporter NhaC [Paraclostridium sordellii]|uniref:Na /H antiporter n=1 Tax=Paraclostridium sordellii TaxID=1505 RepID=A0A0C7QSQ3_PARSO|nr:Na+/H+ antiporter NhaC [Paeniclostridium sordellii]CEN78566.1 Na /H antiporter [[Clostridium] sordellii] [Paeniclostridium sordellii]CEQ03662.1 Na /H antiporter [[Clostridium] sordellii] [Paeniclostridium sordellii]
MSKFNSQKKKPTVLQAIIPILFMIVALAVGYGYLKMKIEPIMVISAFFAAIIALKLGYTWEEMQKSIIDKIASALPATLILWSVGFLIGSLMFAGTVPMIIYYGVQLINPKFILVTAFISSALLSLVTGTSWGAAGTIGVAMMGIAGGLGVSLPATAGAVVAGAFFGDKLSPLSDTTNLAPMAAGSELYEHIKHMLYTTLPAAIVSLIVYLFVGFKTSGADMATPELVTTMTTQLDSMFNFNIVLLMPIVFVILGSVRKWPTIPTMLGSSIFTIILGVAVQGFSLVDGFSALVGGFDVTMTGYVGEVAEEVLKLINRGGVASVTSTTVLIFCAMGFAGIVSVSGMLDVVLELLMSKVKSTFGIILSTIVSCFTVAFVTGSSYLSILIPGELFKDVYPKKGLSPKNLSRTLEDSGTVIVPLVPWSAAGAYMASTLGVSTMEYLPWAVLNYTGIIFAIILAATGFGISKIDNKGKELAKK